MKYFLVTFLVCSLGFLNPSAATVAGNSKITAAINSAGAIGNLAASIKLSEAGACAGQCWWAVGAAAVQTVLFWIPHDGAAESCNQATQNGRCPTPGVPTPGVSPGFNTTVSSTTTPTPTTTTPVPRLGVTPIPRPGTLPPGTTGLKPLTPNQQLANLASKRPDLQNVLNKLAEKGYSIDLDKGTFNGPNGSTPFSKMNDPAFIASMGTTAAGMKMAEEITKKVVDKMKKDLANQIGAIDAGGGGGGNLGNSGAGSEDDALKDYMNKMMARMPAQEKNNINGLSKLVNGEPIGIAAGNIFKTIEMRYDKLEESGTFLGPAAPAQ